MTPGGPPPCYCESSLPCPYPGTALPQQAIGGGSGKAGPRNPTLVTPLRPAWPPSGPYTGPRYPSRPSGRFHPRASTPGLLRRGGGHPRRLRTCLHCLSSPSLLLPRRRTSCRRLRPPADMAPPRPSSPPSLAHLLQMLSSPGHASLWRLLLLLRRRRLQCVSVCGAREGRGGEG